MNLQYFSKLIFSFLFLLFFVQSTEAQDKPKVVATASMIADMVKQIAGDKVNLQCIVPIGGDPHLHTPTPRDVKMVAAADLIGRCLLVAVEIFHYGWQGRNGFESIQGC